ncbi:hypothetical protein [Dyella sp. 2HG41-7]|uniref:hypothetical protein n=1 Tax=Dyella sp. 2HG41-7 TaxID=2883239 RepID=UPI001F278133|nr:hypothetical protein [Dyella sp. 2HG41-7]
MTDSTPLLDAFLKHKLELAHFRHVDHLRVGFELLKRHDFLTAASLFCNALKTMTASAGLGRVYHETISVAFLSLIAERMQRDSDADFAQFQERNADLLDKSVLKRWYSDERLRSDAARQTFVLPEART